MSEYKSRKGRRHFTKEELDYVIACFRRFEVASQVAKTLRCSPSIIYKHYRDLRLGKNIHEGRQFKGEKKLLPSPKQQANHWSKTVVSEWTVDEHGCMTRTVECQKSGGTDEHS